MDNEKDIFKEFEDLYKELLDLEEEFKYRLTCYGTGGKMNLSDIDESYTKIKNQLKKIRKLAKKVTL